jgi:protein gp37
MDRTEIQWCHSTKNPVMGCDGCELWPGAGQVVTAVANRLQNELGISARAILRKAIGGQALSQIYTRRESLGKSVAKALGDARVTQVVVDGVRNQAKCYAGLLGTFRPGHAGYADQFERPKLFAGRMAEAASLGLPTDGEQHAKPWLAGCSRLIFVSDMGDALARRVPFEFLKDEIIENVGSLKGRRHLWLWLTKRPARMAEFGQWLARQGVGWPENLVPMTTVTSPTNQARVAELRRVPSRLRGLSCEPLLGPLDLDCAGIDWVVVGGGSDILAEPFHVEWALEIRTRCQAAQTAFFLKQLGRNPFYRGKPIPLADPHGGDWDEWPIKAWRVRDVPRGFRERRPAQAA